jgi:hypothetical protein
MELTKQHREALLNELQNAKENKELQEIRLNKKENDHLIGWIETHIFLAQERIKLIEQCLINNEIDL